MAEEFVEACRLLWDCWDDDAFIGDKQAGQFVRPGSLHVPHFQGQVLHRRGRAERAARAARPSGADPGRLLRSRPGAGRAHRRRGVHRAERPRRKPWPSTRRSRRRSKASAGSADEVLVMPGVMPVVGRTEAEAQAMFAELNRNIDARQAFTVLSERLGMDMSAYPMDGPVPTPPPTEHLKSRSALLIEMARRDKLTLRELYYRVAAARGHLLLVGTPRADRRRAGTLVPGRRGRRLQRHAALLPRPVRRLRRRRRADPAGTRPLSRGLCRNHPARPSRPEASGAELTFISRCRRSISSPLISGSGDPVRSNHPLAPPTPNS